MSNNDKKMLLAIILYMRANNIPDQVTINFLLVILSSKLLSRLASPRLI